MRALRFSFAMIAGSAAFALAQQPTAPARGTVEAGASAASVTAGYGNWASVYARGALGYGQSTVVFPEVVVSRQFNDRGALLGVGATHTLNEDWYAFGAAATSTGGFYLPRFRGVAVLNRKMLASKQLVLNAGVSYFAAKDAHRDVGMTAGALYYFDRPWIVEGGAIWNTSSPGSVLSQMYFGAITEGRGGDHYVILRVGAGREAYQLLAPGSVVADFRSGTVSLTGRKWLRPSSGVVANIERYENPYYRRTGISLGGFWNVR